MQKNFDLSVYASKGSTLQPQRRVHVKALLDKEAMQSDHEQTGGATEQGLHEGTFSHLFSRV